MVGMGNDSGIEKHAYRRQLMTCHHRGQILVMILLDLWIAAKTGHKWAFMRLVLSVGTRTRGSDGNNCSKLNEDYWTMKIMAHGHARSLTLSQRGLSFFKTRIKLFLRFCKSQALQLDQLVLACHPDMRVGSHGASDNAVVSSRSRPQIAAMTTTLSATSSQGKTSRHQFDG